MPCGIKLTRTNLYHLFCFISLETRVQAQCIFQASPLLHIFPYLEALLAQHEELSKEALERALAKKQEVGEHSIQLTLYCPLTRKSNI